MGRRRWEQERIETPDAELWEAPAKLSFEDAVEAIGEEGPTGAMGRRCRWDEGEEE